jgi:hypothetical protein
MFFSDLDDYMITPYGVQFLLSTSDRIAVHDPDGYLQLFWGANPVPDPEMMRYLGECLEVFRANHLLAAVVLLGVASERLIEVLAMRLRDALGTTRNGNDWYNNTYNTRRNQNITNKFDEVFRRLDTEYRNELNAVRISAREIESIRLAFEAIRNPRNIIAHQHNYVPTWNETGGLLHNFVLYFKLINQIINVMLANPR